MSEVATVLNHEVITSTYKAVITMYDGIITVDLIQNYNDDSKPENVVSFEASSLHAAYGQVELFNQISDELLDALFIF